MKSLKKYISMLAVAALAMGATSCQDDFEGREPAFEAPTAEHQANMSILDLKKLYWEDDSTDYYRTVGDHPDKAGEHIYISGRVISNDADGNVFKNLVIQDESAAIAFSINQYDLYLQFRPGQEIVVDATGMTIGKYRGLMQFGLPDTEKGNVTFMAPDLFRMHAELNGFPEASKIDTITINSFSDVMTVTPDQLQKWQSQLVRFNNVRFQNADGKTVFSKYKSSGVDQPIVDINGQSLNVRTSGYSSFWNNPMPQDNGDVVGILSYYNTSWQILLLDLAGCMNFGNPTLAPGVEDNPYNVVQAIELINAGKDVNAWVTGYIVGAVGPEVESIKGNDDIEWGADVIMDNTLVIGQTPDTKDLSQALVIYLPQGSALRQYGNLADHPENYKKQIDIKGTFGMYMDAYGILNNSGNAATFHIEGIEIGDGSAPAGDGTEAKPYNVSQIVAMNPQSTTDAVATGVWVTGYIVGSMPTGGSSTTLSGAVFGLTDAATTNIVIAPTPDCIDYTKCIGVQLPSGAVRNALNLQQNANMLGAEVALKGDVMKYCGGPGLKTVSEYKVISGGNGEVNPNPEPDVPAGNGDGSEAKPYDVAQIVALNPQSKDEAVASGVWVEGYIVGAMPATNTTLTNTIFGTADVANTNLVMGPTADCKDATKCISVQLPTGAVRTSLNLADNPGNLGKKVMLQGDVMKYCGGPGIKNTKAYKIDGQATPDPTPNPPTGGEGEGTMASPYNVAKALGIISAGSYTDAEVYVKGVIASVTEVSTSYGNATYLISDDGTSANTLTVFRGYYFDGEKFTSESQIKAGDKVVICGKLTLYNGTTPEVTTGSKIVSLNDQNSGGNVTPDPNPNPNPDTPVLQNSADFNTLNGGKVNTTVYSTYTTTSGWTADGALVLSGGTSATNFVSEDAAFLFPCIDGTSNQKGKLTSPTISGGIKTLVFNYGFPFTEKKAGFTVNIIQGGNVVVSETVVVDPATKAMVYTFTHNFNITGDFVIEIVNDCISASTNKHSDRLAIWNLSWNN